MRESLRISVPTPCGEDWAKMMPAGHGRHCGQCCKTVVDFTGMSDGEMLQFFKDRAAEGAGNSHGGVCGRFASDQLQRELAPAPVQRNGFNGWYLVLASALMVAGREEGKAPLKPKMEQRRGAPGDGQGAAVRGTPEVLADTVRDDMIVGEVAAPGVRCVKQDTIKPHAIKPDTIKQPTMGAVAVRTMGKVSHRVDTIAIAPPDAAAAVFPGEFSMDDVVQVYPNPVARGGTMSLQWRASGRYAAALLDLHGQIQQEREVVVAGKGQLDDWAVPEGLAPGVYFLRVSRPGKRAVTKEVVIQ